MMQSKLALKFIPAFRSRFVPRFTRNLSAITGGGRTADPAVHAVDHEETNDASEVAKAIRPTNNDHSEFKPAASSAGKNEGPYVPPESPSYPPSQSAPKVQSTGVNHPPEYLSQQKRRLSIVVDADCVGLDGSPLKQEDRALEGRRQREQQEKDKEYFKHHRASPLSELEIADTRKPVTRSTDGTADSGRGGRPELVLWRPEQLDSAEDSLRRAREIWMNNAIRGDPDSPHGRILRTLRGEDW